MYFEQILILSYYSYPLEGENYLSYDLSVNLKGLNDSIIPKWLSEIRKLNMNVEVHPDFSFNNHSGFLPFKVVIYDCPDRSLNNIELITGFELFISPLEESGKNGSFFSKLFRKQKPISSIEKKLREADTEISFYISAQDSFEFRMGWYSAATLAFLCNGVLTDLQEGIQLEGKQLIKHAIEVVLADEKLIKKDDWRVNEFKEWLG